MQIQAQSQVNPVQEPQKAAKAASKAEAINAMMLPPNQVEVLKDAFHTVKTLPGKAIQKLDDFFSNNPKAIIEETLTFATQAKTPRAEEMALRNFYSEINGMTPGELDDVKDAIVSRMASDNTSQRERDILHKMYNMADAMSENRPAQIPSTPKPWYDKIPMPSFPKPMPLPHFPDFDPKWILAKAGA